MSELDKLLAIKYNNISPSPGKLLLSEPFLNDYYFKRSVVLLIDHNDDGSFGVVLNKPIDAKLSDIISGFPAYDTEIYLGGPVGTDSLFFIHTLGDQIDGSLKIMDGLYWGGDIENVKEMIALNKINSGQIRFYMGYSGWSSKQLEGELNVNSWVVTKTNPAEILYTDPAKMWSKLIKDLGKEYSLWPNFPVDPNVN